MKATGPLLLCCASSQGLFQGSGNDELVKLRLTVTTYCLSETMSSLPNVNAPTSCVMKLSTDFLEILTKSVASAILILPPS